MKDEERVITRPGGALIRYRLMPGEGKEKVLVMLHGMASNLSRWWEFFEKTDLAGSWNLLRMDLRGHGASLYRGRVGMETWSDDLSAVLDAEGFERAVIGGHCLGANLALFFAARHGRRTKGLVLIEPMPPAALTGELKRLQPFKPLARGLVRFILALNVMGMYRRNLPELDLRKLDTETRERVAREGSDEAMTKRYARPGADMRYLPSAVYIQDSLEVSRPLPPLEGIRVPVLSLISAGGLLSNPAVTQKVLERLSGNQVKILPARHWIPTECGDEMRIEIERWCRAREGGV
ncbi:MAG TPA: alpha/beta hydrolase [Nitrospiria bacterium]